MAMAQPSAYAAAPATGTMVGAANGSALSAARLQQLARGAAPTTAAEQAWVAQASQALGAVNQAVAGLVSIATQQAKLGRDINGVPLATGEDHPMELQVLRLVNAERARYGLAPVSYDRRLDAAAESHNAQQVATRTMSHDGIGDGDPGSRIRATGFSSSWGENVATGQLSAEQVVAEWMASPGHRRNVLDPDFRLMGVSYAVGSDGRTYWAQEFGGA